MTSRRIFLTSAASAGVLVAFSKAGPAFAATEPAAAANPAASLLPPNFANPPNSPINAILQGIPLPRLVAIETTFDRPVLANVAQTFQAKLRASHVLDAIRPGMKLAIGAGSRGITNLPLVTRLLIDELKQAGAQPFIFPAMGSHGGATPEGQRAVLERMGFTEKSMGVPIWATMDVVQVGSTPGGLPAYVDAFAAQADGIIVVNRIKPHTTFRGKIESGLTKMIVIGVGKQKGAETCHNLGYGRMEQNLLALGRTTLASGKILFGVGLVENAYHETCRVEVVPAAEIEAREPLLLAEARQLMPTVPISPLDVLIIDEVGKNISGTGFDPNVVGRYPTADVPLTPRDPRITRIAVLDITDVSDGNGTGLGLADFTTERVFRKFIHRNLLQSPDLHDGGGGPDSDGSPERPPGDPGRHQGLSHRRPAPGPPGPDQEHPRARPHVDFGKPGGGSQGKPPDQGRGPRGGHGLRCRRQSAVARIFRRPARAPSGRRGVARVTSDVHLVVYGAGSGTVAQLLGAQPRFVLQKVTELDAA